MNYNNFDQYIKNQQVYSNELHIILSKTPPRLFRLILGAIALAAAVLVSFAFFTRFHEYAETNYLLNVQPDKSVTITALATEQSIAKMANAPSAIIAVNTPGKTYSRNEVNLPLSSMDVQPVYELNGRLYENVSAMGDMPLTSRGLQKKYRLSLQLDGNTAAKYFGEGIQPQTGSIKFLVAKKRLINRFIKF